MLGSCLEAWTELRAWEKPVQRPSCVDMSGPVLQRLWDFQRNEHLGNEVNKVGAGSWTDPVCLHVGRGSPCSPVHLL